MGHSPGKGRIASRENSDGLTNDGKFTLHRRSNRALGVISAEFNAIENFVDGITGSNDVAKVGGRITRHKAIGATAQSPPPDKDW